MKIQFMKMDELEDEVRQLREYLGRLPRGQKAIVQDVRPEVVNRLRQAAYNFAATNHVHVNTKLTEDGFEVWFPDEPGVKYRGRLRASNSVNITF